MVDREMNVSLVHLGQVIETGEKWAAAPSQGDIVEVAEILYKVFKVIWRTPDPQQLTQDCTVILKLMPASEAEQFSASL